MKHITINLENLKNNLRTNNQISTATHDLALYLMLKHKLFRSADNTVYSFRDNTLLRAYFKVTNNTVDNELARKKHKAVAGVITEEVQRLEKLKTKVTIC